MLTRLPITLAQIKTGNNSCKLKKWNLTNTASFVSAQWNLLKRLEQFNQVIIEENVILIKDSETFCFNFDWSKY